MGKDLHQETIKHYAQILDALEELTLLYADADEDEEKEEDAEETEQDLVDGMIEAATERGMDEESVEKIFRAVAVLTKKAKEG